MMVDQNVLRAAAIGLLVEEGHKHDKIVSEWPEGQWQLLPPYVEKAIRKVASVALTFQAHGVLKDNRH